MTNELPVEELEQDLDLELEDDGEEVVTVPKKTLQTLQAQKEHWKNKANKPVEKEQPSVVDTKPQTNSTTEDLSDIRETVKNLSLSEKKRQFGYEHNLSPEETDAVFRLNPNPDKKTLEDPFIKGGLEAIRAKKRVEGAIPSSTGKVPTVNGKTWAQMTAEERQANFSNVMGKRK